MFPFLVIALLINGTAHPNGGEIYFGSQLQKKLYSISIHKLNQLEAGMNLKGTFLVTYV